MRRYLIVANLTLCGPHLIDVVRDRMADGPSSFEVLVPASHIPLGGTWTEAQTRASAGERLHSMLAELRSMGAEASGEVGDISALDATLDAVRSEDFDEIIVSTLPPGASRWLKLDLVSRLERAVDVPVTHVVAEGAGAH
jgi:hypothetical protein